MVFLVGAALYLGDMAHGADQMLVHRVMVVHIELHQSHGMTEFGNEAAQHARLVHQPQRSLRIVARGQRLEESVIGLRIVAHLIGDQVQRARHGAQGMRMNVHALDVGDMEQAQDVGGVLAEDGGIGVQPPVLDIEVIVRITGAQKAGQDARQRAGRLAMLLFQRGADDEREVAHILRHQEVGAHEGFHRPARLFRIDIAQLCRQPRLHVKRQPFFRAAQQVMQPHPHIPQKGLGLLEGAVFLAGEDAMIHQVGGVIHVIEIFADPIERLQVAQAALAFP